MLRHVTKLYQHKNNRHILTTLHSNHALTIVSFTASLDVVTNNFKQTGQRVMLLQLTVIFSVHMTVRLSFQISENHRSANFTFQNLPKYQTKSEQVMVLRSIKLLSSYTL